MLRSLEHRRFMNFTFGISNSLELFKNVILLLRTRTHNKQLEALQQSGMSKLLFIEHLFYILSRTMIHFSQFYDRSQNRYFMLFQNFVAKHVTKIWHLSPTLLKPCPMLVSSMLLSYSPSNQGHEDDCFYEGKSTRVRYGKQFKGLQIKGVPIVVSSSCRLTPFSKNSF